MPRFTFGGNSTYQVGDLKVTSPTPGVFPSDFAAVPGNSTDLNYPLQKRPVVTHYFTGVDVPILGTDSIRARLGPDYPDPPRSGTDSHGPPNALATRRAELLKAAARISLSHTDARAAAGQSFLVRP